MAAAASVRDVDVLVTYSSHDMSPTLNLDGRRFGLQYDNTQRKWHGLYYGLSITTSLRVVFVSEAWAGQPFDMTVTLSDPSGAAKSVSQTFHAIARKGVVTFDHEVNL